ncbi:hypothetical protein Lalb_Chr02g0151311 [Lupinus albus]|uniref:Uncharacterized protein n=1 Tax=Lupinus albus TaxID=3870 RepID=A0A6A4QXX2_LUPAL|nr:hypothetical protein Lalb_Chr02g0151311 [Lupinus albus]
MIVSLTNFILTTLRRRSHHYSVLPISQVLTYSQISSQTQDQISSLRYLISALISYRSEFSRLNWFYLFDL